MRDVIEWWYATDGPSRLWRCVVRYMDQVWTDSNEVLVSVSMEDLRLLREACEDSARRCTNAGGFTIRGMELSSLAADVFWVADQAQRELWESQGA